MVEKSAHVPQFEGLNLAPLLALKMIKCSGQQHGTMVVQLIDNPEVEGLNLAATGLSDHKQ
jgi:hypothetical protein